jgi:hypothetical protein
MSLSLQPVRVGNGSDEVVCWSSMVTAGLSACWPISPRTTRWLLGRDTWKQALVGWMAEAIDLHQRGHGADVD